MSAIPTVAIVGRPNVGKSTLFNRLTGKRAALVSDMPGLTRDRREGQAHLGIHTIKLVDTAGLEESGPGTIAARMRQQSEAAVASADLALFVIDAREGVTAADEAFARVVRASGKPVILVANKAEGRAGESGFYDAYGLGFGEPVAISAEHGEGVGDLVVDLLEALGLSLATPTRKGRARGRDEGVETKGEAGEMAAGEEFAKRTQPIRVAIVGRPNVGKSTLVNALLAEERMITGPEPGLTRDTISSELIWNNRKFLMFDTAGLRRKARIDELAEKLSASDTVRALRFAEVVVLLIDAERAFEHQDLTIGDMVAQEGRAIVVAINKWDLVAEKQKVLRDLRQTVSEKLSQVPGVPFVTISALGEKGLDRLMEAIVNAHETWNKRVPTHDLNRWLQEALARHAPPAVSGRRIRLRYATQVSTRPPTFVAFCSRPAELPRSYVRYLTNSLREVFGMPGVPIRFSLKKSENPYAGRAGRGKARRS
ncbi:MAG TPA: ribosome biogenesis GTPase Der [Hyphomicrobiaceae bacterium]|nr:ribosome biogenesis GTPase Der [Hyphomicrobiaceae bacterium]